MKEEIKDEKLESIIKEVSRNFFNTHKNNQLRDIFNRGGTPNKSITNIDLCSVYTEWGKKYVEFYGEYKEKARSMSELKTLIDYLDKEGYEWI
jgi:hypothetical protein